MSAQDQTARHPIRVVSQRTGLTAATIRAWERRYEAVRPVRSDGGQRLYSDADVARLVRLRELSDAGRPISMVAGLSDKQVGELLQEDRVAAAESMERAGGVEPDRALDRAYELLLALDPGGLERVLWRAAMSLDGRTFLDGVVAPLLVRVGEGWQAGEVSPGQEHLGSDVIDRVLARLSDPSRSPEGPSLVVATLPGERHGLGARLVSAAAAVDGWRVTYLGTDLPVSDIVSTVDGMSATAVAISIVGRDDLEGALRALVELRGLVNPSVDVLVGGRGAQLLDRSRLPAGVMVFDGLEGLRHYRDSR